MYPCRESGLYTEKDELNVVKKRVVSTRSCLCTPQGFGAGKIGVVGAQVARIDKGSNQSHF